MEARSLPGRKVLLVEDEYYLARDLADSLGAVGCEVVGPTGRLKDALRLAGSEAIDAAVLDINLQGEMVYPAAELLLARGIPIIFATGYDRAKVPEPFSTMPRLEKPFDSHQLIELVARLIEEPSLTASKVMPIRSPEVQVPLPGDLQVLAAKWRNIDPDPENSIQELMALTPRRFSLEKNADVAREGDPLRHIYLVLEGIAVRYNGLPDGTRQISAFMLPGDFCDLNGGLLLQRDHSIGAISELKLVQFDQARIADLAVRSQRFKRVADWSKLIEASILRQWIVNLGARPAPQRIAHLFCELHTRMQLIGMVQDGSFDLPMSQQTLSEIIGVSPVHMNRSLKSLRESGLVFFKQSTVSIPDVRKLEAYADFDQSYLHLRSTLTENARTRSAQSF